MDKKNDIDRVDPDNETKPDKTPLNDAGRVEETLTEEMNSSTARTVLEQLEMKIIQGQTKSGIDLSNFSEEQIFKLLELMSKGEENAFRFSMENLKSNERINTKLIDSSIVNQKTLRYVIVGLIFIVFVMLLLILFFKEDYFITFLSFITGLCGGAGLRELFSKSGKPPGTMDSDDK
jgi:hypothetical protein